MDYSQYVDRFAKTADVTSMLMYGDLDVVGRPWLTVLIPTYKKAELLQQALDSVLQQWHTHFAWDIVVLDNESYDGEQNATEKLIRKVNNPRILYYRNSANMHPADNLNRGIQLARGKWVCVLYDDNFLIHNALQYLERLIKAYENIGEKPLGAISTKYVTIKQKEKDPWSFLEQANGLNGYLCTIPTQYNLYKLTHANLIFTSHMGGSVLSNEGIFLREALIHMGGFNETYGISADLTLFYHLEEKYDVYSTIVPLGLYRWGTDKMIEQEFTCNIIKNGYNFREYIYKKHTIIRTLLRRCHYKRFSTDVVNERNSVAEDKIKLSDFDEICSERPSKLWYFVYTKAILKIHAKWKAHQTKRLGKKAWKVIEESMI